MNCTQVVWLRKNPICNIVLVKGAAGSRAAASQERPTQRLGQKGYRAAGNETHANIM